MKILKFDKKIYPFDKLLSSLYDYNLNELNDNLDHSQGAVGMDTDSIWHSIFYDKLRAGWPEFIELYKSFIQNVIGPMFTEESKLIYQKTPSFRVNQPEGKAIYTPHCDGDHLHKHPTGEINIIMPLTKMWDTNGVYIESIPGLADYKSRPMEFGEFIMFYGNKLRHHNKFNNTGVTRCSFDFRVIPPVNYDSSYNGESATMSNKFIIGEYYNILNINKNK
jgi:hypothetical protein